MVKVELDVLIIRPEMRAVVAVVDIMVAAVTVGDMVVVEVVI